MKRFVNILTFMLFIFAYASDLYADEQSDSLIVTTKDGDSCIYVLENGMNLSFVDDRMYINSQDVSFMVDSIAKIHFFKSGDSGDVSPIREIKSPVTTVNISYLSRNTICIKGVESTHEPRVYSIKGAQMPFDVDCNGDEMILHLHQYPSGTYIIKVGKHSFKILVK